MKYDFITIGGATRDIAFFTDEGIMIDDKSNPFNLHRKLLAFEYGAKMRIDKFINLFGGGAANASVNLVGLGFRTAALLETGNDENGRAIVRNLKDRGVLTPLVHVNDKADSGSSFILITNGERIIFSTRGVNDYLELDAERVAALKKADNIYIASLTGNWQKCLRQIFSSGHKKIFWNPGSKQYNSGVKGLGHFLKKTYCLMLNHEEALALVLSDLTNTKQSHLFFKDMNNILKIIKSYGPEIVVITDGAEGSYFYDGVKFYHQSVLKERKHLDTTGIGDVHNSTFAAGLLLYKGNISKAAYLASKNAAHKISYLGAQNGLLTKDELMTNARLKI
ncbi:MAG: carbohydrate kinase family protein [Patescibacteria group bacterium]